MRLLIPPWEFPGFRLEAGLVETPGELIAWGRHRYHAFCEPTHPGDVPRLDASKFPMKIELGDEDEYSYSIVAEKVEGKCREIVGGFRFIPCEHHFFIEGTQFNGHIIRLPKEHRGQIVRPETTFEASRWCGHPMPLPSDGEASVLVSMLLAEAGQQLSKELGRTHWFCAIDHAVAKPARKDGWQIDPIIPGVHQYLNRPTQICIIPLNDYKQLCRRTIPTQLLTKKAS